MTYAFVFFIVGIVLAVFLGWAFGPTYLFIGLPMSLASGFLGWKYMYIVLGNKVKAQSAKLALMFPEFLTTFMSLLGGSSSGNVITTIEATIPYIKEPLRGHVVKLVKQIYDDPSMESVWQAFTQFSRELNDKESEQIMSLVSDMYVSGINQEALSELENRVEVMKQNRIKAYAEKKANKLKNKASLPSLGLSTMYIFGWAGTIAVHYLMVGLGGMSL